MTISSLAFKDKGAIPQKYSCEGDNISPPLTIGGIPRGAKSLVLILDDPDSAYGNFLHWIVWNINPQKVTKITSNQLPQGAVTGVNDFGRRRYDGPCPQKGKHRYYFTVYALDTKLDLDIYASRSDLQTIIKGHVLDQASLMGTYILSETQK